jgi:hypothetical protein
LPRRCTAWLRTLAATAALSVLAGAAAASPFAPILRLRADPNRVPADGETAVAISVEVLDATGMPVPDGTPVYFDTTLGEIVSPVDVLGGLAQTVLRPSNIAGTALVSAMVGGVRGTVEVEFLPTAGSASPGSRLVEITADELSYSGERRIFVATWNAELRYQTIEIRADSIHYDVSPNVVCAQGDVTLQSGERTLRADALRYELRSLRGRLLRVTDGVERLVVEGDALETRPDPAEDSRLWEPLLTDDTRTWVKVQRAIIDPGHKVILDHATFYVDDTRVMSLRRHVLDPRSGEALFGNTFGYSSGYGVDMDFPIYYRASGHRVGSLHIARNRAVGGWQYEPGWSLGLKEEYFREGRSEGAFTLQDIIHPDRGLKWEHRHQIGGGSRVALNASTTSFEEDGPRLRSTGASYFRPVPGGRLSLSFSRSSFGASESQFSDLAYRLRTFRVAGDVLAVPVFHLRHSRSYNEQEGIIVDPSTGEPFQIALQSTGRATSPGVDVSFELPTRDLDSRTKLHARLMTGYAWRLSAGSRGVLDARLGVTRRTGPLHFLKLDYSYASTPAGIQPTLFAFGRQTLSLSGTTMVKGCQVRFNTSRELDGGRSFGSVHLTRPLPFGADQMGRPLWSLDASHFFSRLEDYRVASSRFSLNRDLGRYRASLCFSPQGHGGYDSRPWMSSYGYGYTYSGGRNFWLEFAAAGP